MEYKLPNVQESNVAGKRVFLLSDLDVPLAQPSAIEDDSRLVAGLPTIKYLLEQGAVVIVVGKLGRPEGMSYEERSRNKELSLKLVASWFAKSMIHDSSFIVRDTKIGEFEGWEITPHLFLLENLRFYPEEEKNDSEFARKLASLADIYVNDAFSLCHRNHASVAGVANILPHFTGLHLQKEVSELSKVLENPRRPLVVIIGGKKTETKLPLVVKMASLADHVLVGGRIAQELKEVHPKIVIATSNPEGTDISDDSLEQFKTIIKTAKMLVWNGPMGRIENSKLKIENSLENSEKGTIEIAKGIVKSEAYKVVGGGDTTEFLRRIGLIDKFDFVSTGGGAMLAFLAGEKLPGLEALIK